MLSPAPRWQILLGKNLALLPMVLGLGLIYLALAGLVRHLPLAILLAAPVQLLTAFLLLSLYGNFLSICLPLRIAAGSLKPTKAPTTRTFLLVLSSLFSVVVVAPVVAPALLAVVVAGETNPRAPQVTLLFSVAELALLAPLYPFALRRLGALFQRREREILQIVTQEVE